MPAPQSSRDGETDLSKPGCSLDMSVGTGIFIYIFEANGMASTASIRYITDERMITTHRWKTLQAIKRIPQAKRSVEQILKIDYIYNLPTAEPDRMTISQDAKIDKCTAQIAREARIKMKIKIKRRIKDIAENSFDNLKRLINNTFD